MKKKIIEMKKRIMYFSMAFLLMLVFVLVPVNVYAADPIYLDYAEPTVSENSGYVAIKMASGNVLTFFWSAYSESGYLNDPDSLNTGASLVIKDKSVSITILTDTNLITDVDNVKTQYTIGNYVSSGKMSILKSGAAVDTNPTYTYTFTGSSSIVGFTYKGNVSLVTDQLASNDYPIVVFGDDVTGQYIADLYLLVSSNNLLMQTYFPKLNQLQLLVSGSKEQLELLVSITEDLLDELIATGNYISDYLPYLLNIHQTLSRIDYDVNSIDTNVNNIYIRLGAIRDLLTESTGSDSERVDDFKEDSDSQSDSLNDLNDQTEVDKIDVDNASDSVDDNLDIEVDANYGVLLSAITENKNILTMLLAVASMGLISYVLFGKR